MPKPENFSDTHNLARFTEAQDSVYSTVLSELQQGKKTSHWMWFIFPQLVGLGRSPTAEFYAIKSLEEAGQYLQHPLLGARIRECSAAVLCIRGRTIENVFGFPDYLKLKSCMTLFSSLADPDPVFAAVLDRFFPGERDSRTLQLLKFPTK